MKRFIEALLPTLICNGVIAPIMIGELAWWGFFITVPIVFIIFLATLDNSETIAGERLKQINADIVDRINNHDGKVIITSAPQKGKDNE